ncbi:MAG: hypothetical protein QOH93_526 [Chloroflexia bacterium]|nr:hypothetical protein [Chloroflexia bacterium]
MSSPTAQPQSLKMTAVLAEFTAMRAEIQYRSDFQQRILQIHIAFFSVLIPALVASVSAAAAQVPALSVLKTIAPWIVLIVPVESALFGLWYVDHGITIGRLGEYIRTKIETRVAGLLGSAEYFNWESYNKVSVDRYAKPRFRILLLITFSVPAVLCICLGCYYLFLLEPPPYEGVSWYLAFLILSIGFALFIFYLIFLSYMQRAFAVEGRLRAGVQDRDV